MVLSADDYLQQLQALLPPGRAWPRRPDAALTLILSALADEPARIDARAEALRLDANPAYSDELAPEWQAATGQPDMDAVRAHLLATGGATPAYFVGLADALGVTITITAPLAGFTPNFNTSSACVDALQGVNGAFRWRVSLAGPGPNTVLESMFRLVQPAHTLVEFTYI
jgi:uncharacterized protein YmfQ (DUF2313 family)